LRESGERSDTADDATTQAKGKVMSNMNLPYLELRIMALELLERALVQESTNVAVKRIWDELPKEQILARGWAAWISETGLPELKKELTTLRRKRGVLRRKSSAALPVPDLTFYRDHWFVPLEARE